MNKKEILKKMKAAGFSLSGWCRRHGFQYHAVRQMFIRPGDFNKSYNQLQVKEKLKEDGLYVEGDAA